ncbi:MAG TPA: type ISP restriction/modification enzyme [Blastocatellia bacterium]|nr:type ISP restriction/modification enzyme [Blastocatellia bacterium]
MPVLDHYLRDIRETYATGENVKETSFYPALANLLNAVGAMLNPKVRIVINIRNRGAGLPDGGLFTAKQLKRAGGDDDLGEAASFRGRQPERGVVEVKGAREDLRAVAESEQVRRYLNAYGQVLVTNLREFLLVTKDQNGELRLGEGYSLAASERELWDRASQPQAFAAEHDAPFTEYIKRVMLTPAPLEDPKDLAWFLASYARDAKTRVERAELPSLQSVREALEQALEIKFEGARGEAFFRSTLVQTLFYGVFSAWVLWAKSPEARRERFNWRLAAWSLHVPVIRTLFEQVVTPDNVRGLGLEEVLDRTADTLNRVSRAEFFTRFEEEHAVQYFYEPFLEAFDPDLRKQLGVWYTPEEIVRYMVERVDRVLRSELGIENGLADERVYVLDPCCGTGAYLVEVLRRIKRTIDEQGGDALAARDLKRAARERVFGFEILPAPFVVAHLQLGLLLQKEGSALKGDERVGVYLTNALTGWEPPKEAKKQLAFEFKTLQEERDAAEEVKRDKPILVVLGNPPYNAFAGTSAKEEGGIVDVYKEGLIKEWGIKKFNLDDLYVRFFRLAERRIAEKTGEGIVSFISNYSWTNEPSYVVLRKRLLESFDKFWVENMHGNRKKSEYAPDGRTSETVFAIKGFSPGIQQGVVISTWVKTDRHKGTADVYYRDDLHSAKAEERRAQLLASLNAPDFDEQYSVARPTMSNRYSFQPTDVTEQYFDWPRLDMLSDAEPFAGFLESRRGGLIDVDKNELAKRIRMFYDPTVEWRDIEALGTGITEDASDYKAKTVRAKVQAGESYNPDNIRRFIVRPFDVRWCYYSSINPFWNRSRPEFWRQCWQQNKFIVTRMATEKNAKGSPFYFSSTLVDYQALARNVSTIPLQLRAASSAKKKNHQQDSFFADAQATTANLSARARAYLDEIGVSDPDSNFETAALIWFHALAIGYSPAYLNENSDGIRSDFPRVPLPASRELLEQSAALGRQVAALLDTESPVSGVTTGAIRPELRTVAVIRRTDGAGSLDPEAGDLELRAGWGHRGKGNVVMPGKGRLSTRDFNDEETRSLDGSVLSALGSETHNVYLNDRAAWTNVPSRVWQYTIGGYQVIKKWLSYRELDILGRSLTDNEAREVTQIARRIAAILLLEGQLDENYERVKSDSYDWKEKTAEE